MPLKPAEFSDLLYLLYQAPSHHDAFRPFLQALIRCLKLADAALYVQQHTGGEIRHAWMEGPAIPALLEFVEADFQHGDYMGEHLAHSPEGAFYSLALHIGRPHLDDMPPQDQPVERWFARHRFSDVASCVIGNEHDERAIITLHRQLPEQAFSAQEIQQLDQLAPHLQQAFSLFQQIHHGRHQASTLHASLDFINHPAMLYDERAKLVGINTKASKILPLHPVLGLSDSRLQFRCARLTQRFNQLLLKTVHSHPNQRSYTMAISQTSPPLTLLMVPATSEYQGRGALVYLYEREYRATINSALLISLFGLTASEAQLCELLALGLSREEIAEHTRRSIHTVRDHIKAIFSKTGTSRQSDLIAILLNSPAATPLIAG